MPRTTIGCAPHGVDQRWAWRCSISSTERADAGRRERKPRVRVPARAQGRARTRALRLVVIDKVAAPARSYQLRSLGKSSGPRGDRAYGGFRVECLRQNRITIWFSRDKEGVTRTVHGRRPAKYRHDRGALTRVMSSSACSASSTGERWL